MNRIPHRPASFAPMARALLWFAAVSVAAPAAARADGFRCGTKLIVEGSTRGEVIARCGEPTDVARRTILRRPVLWRFGRPYYLSDDLTEVPVETWTYNLGPNKLMRRLRLEDDVVVDIDTLGYGYHGAAPPSLDRRR